MSADQTTTAPDDSRAEGLPTEEQDILDQVKQWWKESDKASSTWRDNAKEDYAFYSNDQWSAEDKAKLHEQLRPCVTINRVGPVIDSVSGMEVGNRQEVRYIPRTEGDAGVNEVLTGAAQWMRDECDAEDEESDAFLDVVICGEGATETRLDYEADPDGMIQISRVDPLELWWDPSAKKRNRDDGRYVIRVKEVPLPEAQAMFPDVDEGDLDASWARPDKDGDGQAHDATEAPQYENDQGAKNSQSRARKVTLVEAQWWEREPVYRVFDEGTGQSTMMKPADFAKLRKRMAALPPQLGMPEPKATKQTKRVFKRAFIGGKLLAPVDTPCAVSFTYRSITGKRDRNNGTWYGLVAAMKDPQRWANKFFSTIQHAMSTAGKGVMAERGAFDNPREAEDNWARPDAITWLKPGGAEKVVPKPPHQFPPQIQQMMEFAVSSIRDATGVNVEMLGLADRQQAGVLEAQRTKAGMTILATLFDSLRRYRKEQGRVLLWFIQNFLSDGRLIRIVGEEGKKYVPLVRDPQTVTYDVIVDDSPTSPNQKEATWAVIGQLMPTLMSGKIPLPPEAWSEIIKQSPLPDSFAEKMTTIIKEAQAKQAQQGPPPDPAMVKVQQDGQLAQQKLQLDAQAKAAESQRKDEEAKANIEATRASAVAALAKAGVTMRSQQLAEFESALNSLLTMQDQGHAQGLAQDAQAHQQGLAEQQQAMAADQQQHAQGLASQESGAKVEKMKQPPAAAGKPAPAPAPQADPTMQAHILALHKTVAELARPKTKQITIHKVGREVTGATVTEQ